MRYRMFRRALPAVLALAAACNEPGPADPNGPGVLSLALESATAPADGATVLAVTGMVDPDTRGEQRKLTFTTSAGSFTEGDGKTVTVTADENGVARVGLRAPAEPAMTRVRVSVENVVRQDSVIFTRALPEAITVEPEKFALSAGIRNEIRVTAQLRRSTGKVSPLTPVSFRAYRAGTNQEIGLFGVPTASDANGVVTVRYTAGNTTYRGPVRIVATFAGEGAPVSGEAVIEITD